MNIEVREVKTRKDLKRFIYLPEKIHAGRANWVPPLYYDEWKYFDPKKNKAFSYCDTILLLALRGKKIVGRIMGIINSRYNQYKKEQTARFGYLETWEEEEAVRELLGVMEDWARKKGCRQLKIETQNVNVPACRFYARQGCELGAIHRYGYAGCPDVAHEAMLLWYLKLCQPAGKHFHWPHNEVWMKDTVTFAE